MVRGCTDLGNLSILTLTLAAVVRRRIPSSSGCWNSMYRRIDHSFAQIDFQLHPYRSSGSKYH